MGGMGFIERFRVECLRSILINTHMIEAACRAVVTSSLPRPALTIPCSSKIRASAPSRSRMPTPQWPSAATDGKSSSQKCSVRNIGQSGDL
jgi:hypothetical protein